MLLATAIIAGLLTAAGTDTPIEPITEAEVTLGLSLPAAEELCTNVSDVHSGIDQIGVLVGDLDTVSYLHDWADAFFVEQFESSMEGALTVEAKEVYTDWLDDCRLS